MSQPLRFINPAAACYLNAAVQLLNNVHVTTWGTSPVGQYLNELQRAQQNGQSGVAIDLTGTFNMLLPPQYRYAGEQGDVHEMLMAILNALRNDALVGSIFGLKITQLIKCTHETSKPPRKCPYHSRKVQTVNQLTVDNSSANMVQFFNKFHEMEVLDEYLCERCAVNNPTLRTRAELTSRIASWPPYLLVQISRFDANGRKASVSFDVPLSFRGKHDNPSVFYIMESCVLHRGHSLKSGHFVVRRRDNTTPTSARYFESNDAQPPRIISHADMSSDLFQREVYLLLYRRVVAGKN